MISSERLLYNRIKKKDRKSSLSIYFDPEIMKHITGKPLSEEEAEIRFQKQLAINKENPGIGHFLVNHKQNGYFLGHAKLTFLKSGIYEIGYAIIPKYWHKGFATEILKTLIFYAKTIPKIETLIGMVDRDNIPSIRVLEKQLFIFDHKFKENNRESVVYKLELNK